MDNHSYEIEIKSLLGDKANAEKLQAKLSAADPNLKIIGSHKQLNHYFTPIGGNLNRLYDNVAEIIEADKKERLKALAERAKDFSVRTRWADGKAAPHTGDAETGTGVILVIKASVDDTTSSNGTARLEWESLVSIPLLAKEGPREVTAKNPQSIDVIDQLVLKSGFAYQAKWSRERQEFMFHPAFVGNGRDRSLQNGINISIDKNAGYGYLAEFEMVVDDKNKAEETKTFLRQIMQDLDVEELPQERLARMFEYYNKNWREYYGTDKTFTIE